MNAAYEEKFAGLLRLCEDWATRRVAEPDYSTLLATLLESSAVGDTVLNRPEQLWLAAVLDIASRLYPRC